MMAAQQGWGQQTPAVQNMIRNAFGRTVARAKRRVSRKAAASPSRKRRRSTSSGKGKTRSASSRVKARMVKGSAAAKRYMAKIRKLRK